MECAVCRHTIARRSAKPTRAQSRRRLSYPLQSRSRAFLPPDIEALIRRADATDPAAVDELFSVLYRELHAIAERALRHGGGAMTLGATTLLHEAYLNLAGRDGVEFQERGRFLAYAARAMRGLMIDYVRRRRAIKRGAGFEITLVGDEGPAPGSAGPADELEHLGDALNELAAVEPQLAELVDLHFFGGFTFVEIAMMRGVSERTVQRDWRKARVLLHHAMQALE